MSGGVCRRATHGQLRHVPFALVVLAAFGWPRLTAGSPVYDVVRKGQDVVVSRASDGVQVFFSGVADTSEGSDTDADLAGDEEFFHGCLWTFRQKVELCDGGTCGEAELMAHDLQRRLLRFYREPGLRTAPPLEEAAWLAFGTRLEQRREIADSCPGLVVTVLLFIAEALFFSGSGLADALAREAETYAAALERGAPVHFETMLAMFPVQEAWGRQQLAHAALTERLLQPRGVDVVVARCSSSLQWLWELELPPGSRVLVYEKCGKDAEDFREQTSGLDVDAEQIHLTETGIDGKMTGECTAYLAHIVGALRGRGLADYTVFVHDDAPRHIRLSLLNLALRGLKTGTYNVPFLHLVHERYPSFRTPCLAEVYTLATGEELEGSVSTYCCAHFVVGREAIMRNPPEFYEHLTRLVSEAPYGRDRGGSCGIGRKPCYVMEFLWHRFFGEPEELPLRSEDARLPLALRFEGGRSSVMPSPLKVSPYMGMFQPTRYSSKLQSER